MSTPSKKRRQAREWMHQAVDTFEKKGAARGFRDGAARMRDDMMRLLPDRDNRRSHEDERGLHVTSVINAFPDPYEDGPYYRVPMPAVSSFDLGGRLGTIPERYNTVDFRPIEHAITNRGPTGSATLRWFTWEPTSGSDELGERTAALFTGLGKLTRAASYVEFATMRYGAPELIEARDMIRDAADELRRRLGKFAPSTLKGVSDV